MRNQGISLQELFADLDGAQMVEVDEEIEVAGVWYGSDLVLVYDTQNGRLIGKAEFDPPYRPTLDDAKAGFDHWCEQYPSRHV